MLRVVVWMMAGALLGAAPGVAGADASAGVDWDEGPMRSRYRSVLDAPSPPPVLLGADRYRAIENASDAAPSLHVPEAPVFWTQRPWRSGPARGASSAPSASGSPLEPLQAGTGRSGVRSTSGSSAMRSGVRTSRSR